MEFFITFSLFLFFIYWGRRLKSSPSRVYKSPLGDTLEMSFFMYAFTPVLWVMTLYVMCKKTFCQVFLKKSPEVNLFLFDGFSSVLMNLRKGAASGFALKEIYNYPFTGTFLERLHLKNRNAQAVRNRARMVRDFLYEELLRQAERNGGVVRILSFACGSAQPLLEAVERVSREFPTVRVSVCLTDISREVLKNALSIAENLNIRDRVSVRVYDVRTLLDEAKLQRRGNIISELQPHIIEMAGLIDYFSNEDCVYIFSKIRGSLPQGSAFLTCTIHNNLERWFLKWVIDWDMIYRSRDTLEKIGHAAEFASVETQTEPHGIHSLLMCR